MADDDDEGGEERKYEALAAESGKIPDRDESLENIEEKDRNGRSRTEDAIGVRRAEVSTAMLP
jgi:hypothetical protein